jgi:hypothetical protein
MRRLLLASAVLILPSAWLGCGEDKKTDTIQTSPEAKKADEGAQKGMQDFMKTKGQSRPNK